MMGLRAKGLVLNLLLMASITLVQCQQGPCKSKSCPRFTVLSPSDDDNFCYADNTQCLSPEKSPYPYLSYNGDIIANNSLVKVKYMYKKKTVIGCHTNIEPCCNTSRDDGSHMGNWHLPNGSSLTGFNEDDDVYQNYSVQRVNLHHSGTPDTEFLGVYCCKIDTLNGHSGCVEKSVCVGLYKDGVTYKNGVVETEADIRINVTSRYDAEVPVFDLTGFSHRAVATTAEWTIDGVKVPAIPVLKTASNSEYFSKLTLRGRVERFARYTVFNKHSKHSTNFFNFFKYKRDTPPVPRMVTAEFNGDIVEVSWTSNISEVITGFTVFYEGDDGSQGSKSIPKEEEEVSLEGLSKCVFYKIKVMATSVYSYSENSTAIGVSPKPCCDSNLMFQLQFSPVHPYNTWTNSYAREIEENIHSELRKHLWSTSVRFCCGAFSNSSISMVNYKASVDDPKVLSDIADWKEMQQCQLGKFLVELNKNFPISPEDNDIC